VVEGCLDYFFGSTASLGGPKKKYFRDEEEGTREGRERERAVEEVLSVG
jgi:hypothetical protein